MPKEAITPHEFLEVDRRTFYSATTVLRRAWAGEYGDIGHSAPVWCKQHLCYCTDAETKLHKHYSRQLREMVLGDIDVDRARLSSYFAGPDTWWPFDWQSPVQKAFFQRTWRCEHHPSAIDNWGDCRPFCEHGCHKSELRWYDNGTCKPPTF